MSRIALIIVFLLIITVVPVVVNITLSMPATINIARHSSMAIVSDLSVLGGGEEWETPFDPA